MFGLPGSPLIDRDALEAPENRMAMALTSARLSVVIVAFVVAACATKSEPPPPPALMLSAPLQELAPPSEELRASLDAVGVATAVTAPSQQVSRPVRNESVGRAAAKGAAKGALFFLLAPFEACCTSDPYAGALLILTPLLAPVGAVVGAGAGAARESAANAANTIPADVVEEMETALQQVLAEQEPQARLRQGILAHAAARNMTVLNPDPNADLGTVLEVGVSSVGLVGVGGRDPELTLVIEASARLLDTVSSRELWAQDHMVYTTSPHKFSLWNANDRALIKSAMNEALETLAHRIDEKVFLEVWID
jgi:hypothetical protein